MLKTKKEELIISGLLKSIHLSPRNIVVDAFFKDFTITFEDRDIPVISKCFGKYVNANVQKDTNKLIEIELQHKD